MRALTFFKSRDSAHRLITTIRDCRLRIESEYPEIHGAISRFMADAPRDLHGFPKQPDDLTVSFDDSELDDSELTQMEDSDWSVRLFDTDPEPIQAALDATQSAEFRECKKNQMVNMAVYYHFRIVNSVNVPVSSFKDLERDYILSRKDEILDEWEHLYKIFCKFESRLHEACLGIQQALEFV